VIEKKKKKKEEEEEEEGDINKIETSMTLSTLQDIRKKRLAVTTIQLMDGASAVSETWLIVT